MHQNTVPIVPSTLAATGIFSPAMMIETLFKMKINSINNSIDDESGRELDIFTKRRKRS